MTLTMAQDALVLVRTLVPVGLDDYLTQIEQGLEDPRYVTVINPVTAVTPPGRRLRRSQPACAAVSRASSCWALSWP
jgi:hypothetical protein